MAAIAMRPKSYYKQAFQRKCGNCAHSLIVRGSALLVCVYGELDATENTLVDICGKAEAPEDCRDLWLVSRNVDPDGLCENYKNGDCDGSGDGDGDG